MVSIRDVAKRAGVAISTVSKVLNHYPNVSEETKEKVEAAIRELNFVPNTVAAALSSKRTGRIALLINLNTQTQAIDEIDMRYISGAISRAGELELDVVTVFFSTIRNMDAQELARYFSAQSVGGIIIYGMSREDRVLREFIESGLFKIVLVDAPVVNATTSCVWVDQRQAQYDVAAKTLETNKDECRKMLYIAGKKDGYVTWERLFGIKRLAGERKLSLRVEWGGFSELSARRLTFQYGEENDIIVCASDLMAIGAMRALTEMDIFRPVCGFDGITLMGYAGKQMNTVNQNFSAVSSEAVNELHWLLNGGEGREVVLGYTLERLEYLDIIR